MPFHTMTKNLHHQEIFSDLKRVAAASGARYRIGEDIGRGSSKPVYMIRAAVFRACVKAWTCRHPDLTPHEYGQLLDSLSRGETSTEFYVIGELLRHLPKLRVTLEPKRIAPWLGRAEGWCEVDSICQSTFTAEEMLAEWSAWKQVLASLAKSKNLHHRRASLVLLTKPLRDSADTRLGRIAFANVDRLKHERDILITKAVSWLLRDAATNYRRQVEACLKENADSLPKIAIRETNKLRTGVKSGHLKGEQKKELEIS
jgi:3-methyladenine DNA glycosylase AlkD